MSGILNPLIQFLTCLAAWVVGSLAWAFAGLVQVLVTALLALAAAVLSLLPVVSLPSLDLGSSGLLATANYFFPLDQLITALGVVLTVTVAWWLISIGLRWAKVTS